jgi:TP901 family phage tail tape measure protein
MADVAKGIIDIQINTGSAAAEIKNLQRQLNAFNLSLNQSRGSHAQFSAMYAADLAKSVAKTGVFTAEMVKMKTAAAGLDSTLKKGQATLGQFYNAAFNRNSSAFAETMSLARQRALTAQTQFVATAGAAKGMQESLKIAPLKSFASQTQVAAERQALLNTMFRQGSTHVINFGKNVQWAGRQLMVGFTVPLTTFGMVAGKTFIDIEKQLVNLKKVYGDVFTTPEEVNQNIAQVRQLAEEYTKYGIAVKDTIGMAANAAASGARNGDLIDATRQATRLATLGQMDQQEALKTTIALQSAFRLSGEDLADTINFLNMVENQTVVSLQDLSAAIPRVAPVIKGLGGDVRDMSVFLAAMQEGGVSAEQGANALKSGLASLINPTKAATETLSGFGINLEKIVSTNRGDLMGTVFAFGEALKGLDDFSKQQALEKVFGKYQYARLGALFENIVRDGSQASQVLNLMEYDVESLRASAERELSAVENALGTQLIGAVERLKLSLEPIGKVFVQIAIPIVNFLTTIIEKFNGLDEGTKRFAALAALIVGVVVPAGTMFLGLLLNLVGTLAKITHGAGVFGKAFIKGGPVAAVKALTQSTQYLTVAELETAAAAKQLGAATQFTSSAFVKQAEAAGTAINAVTALTAAYKRLIASQIEAAAIQPRSFGAAGAARAGAAAAGAAGKSGTVTVRALRRNAGGPIFMTGQTMVPGVGSTDTVPAMLTPGEFVVNKDATRQNRSLLESINSGSVGKFNNGGMIPGVQYFAKRMPNRLAKPVTDPDVAARRGATRQRFLSMFGGGARSEDFLNARVNRRMDLRDVLKQTRTQGQKQQKPAKVPKKEYELTHMLRAEDNAIADISKVGQVSQFMQKIVSSLGGKVGTLQKGFTVFLPGRINQDMRSNRPGVGVDDFITEVSRMDAKKFLQPLLVAGKAAGVKVDPQAIRSEFLQEVRNLKKIDPNFMIKDPDVGAIYQGLIKRRHPEIHDMLNKPFQFRTDTKSIMQALKISKVSDFKDPAVVSRLNSEGFRVISNEEYLMMKKAGGVGANYRDPDGKVGVYFTSGEVGKGKLSFVASDNAGSGSTLRVTGTAETFIPPELKGLGKYFVTKNSGGMIQKFGARMPGRVVKSTKTQIGQFSGRKVADSTGHSSAFREIAGTYEQAGRQFFVKPFKTLQEAQAEAIGNSARRNIAGVGTPSSKVVVMNGPDGPVYATVAPMIGGIKAGTTLTTKELLKQIPSSSMLGDLDVTAANIASTRGGRLLAIDPGAAGVKVIRNSKGVFRRATGSEISFKDEAVNSGAYTAKAITQVIEKTGASKDYVKMLGDSIAREKLTEAQFVKMYDDVVASSLNNVKRFKVPSSIGDRKELDALARKAGFANADEAYVSMFTRDLSAIRGLGGSIFSSASRHQGMLKANSGTLVPGMGNTDTVPAMLTPGEFVVNKEATQNNLPLLHSINDGKILGFNAGGKIPGVQYFAKKEKKRIPTAQRGFQGGPGPYPTDRGQGPGQNFAKMVQDRQRLEYEMRATQEKFAANMKMASAFSPAVQMERIANALKEGPKNIQKGFKDAGKEISKGSRAVSRGMLKSAEFVGDKARDGSDKVLAKRIDRDFGKLYKQAHKDNIKFNNNTPAAIAARQAEKDAKKQSRQDRRKERIETAKENRGRIGGAMMGAAMIPMMASSMVKDEKQADMMMKASTGMMALGALTSMGPKAAIATAAIAALGYSFVKLRGYADEAAKSSANVGANIGGAANRMKTVTDATGYSFASTRTGNKEFRFTEKQAEGASEIMPYFDTEEGSKMIDDLKKVSSEKRYEKVASMLEMAIADGMDPEKAEAFGSAIAFALDDKLLKSKVVALINSGSLGQGSDAMIKSIQKRQEASKTTEDLKNMPQPGTSMTGIWGKGAVVAGLGAAGGLAVGAAIAGSAALAGTAIAAGAAMGSVVPVIGTVVGAVVGAGVAFAMFRKQANEVKKNIEVVGRTFGSSIQVLKELNNAEALLNEERKSDRKSVV